MGRIFLPMESAVWDHLQIVLRSCHKVRYYLVMPVSLDISLSLISSLVLKGENSI